jgi:hypothetical protein
MTCACARFISGIGPSSKYTAKSLRLRVIDAVLINPLNAKLNSIYHLLALLGAHHIFHVSRVRVKVRMMTEHYIRRVYQQ